MQFANLSALYYLWLVPLLGALFLWAARRKKKAVSAFGDQGLMAKLSQAVSPLRDRLKSGLVLAAVFFLVLALARPQWGERTEEVVRTGVDVFIALDTSLSMDATDIAPSRLEKARHIAANLIDRLQGNRVGLIVFAGSAFVQCPLTLDEGAARIFLDSVTTGAVAETGTNLASAIDAARKGFVSKESKYKVVVLLTDGEQHEGNPMEVAEQARQEGVVIHTIGVGTAAGDPIPIRDARGEITDYKRDEAGQPVLSRLDEDSLSRIALATGGEYYRASDNETEAGEIADLVASMEGKELSAQLFTRYEERYYWPLAFAVAFLIAESAIPRGRRRKKEAIA
jgi:Ca-activated chloride channel family protein